MEETIDIDTMLWHVGDFGKYQFMLMFLFSAVNVFSGFHYFGQTFISVVPEHMCRLNESDDPKLVIASQCYKNFIEDNTTSNLVPCTNWTYHSTYGYISIVEQLDWVCTDDWKPALGQSIFFIGSVAGSLIFGILADRIGRLHVLVFANLLACAGNLATLLATNVVTFSLGRFVAGCATDSNFVMMYIIVMEYIRPSMRTLGLNLCIGIFYCISCMAVPWVAVCLSNWRIFLLVISLPNALVVLFYLVVPESAQWLISKGKTEKAIKCFKRIAQYNGRDVNEKYYDALRKYCEIHVKEGQKNENLMGLLKTPKLRKKTLILVFKSMVMTLCYDAISRNVNGIGYPPFIVFTITSSTILPACLFILLIQDKVGRKALASGALLACGIITASSGIFQASITNPESLIIMVLAITSRLAINVAYNSGAQYAVELIPTVVRGQGVSAIHVAGYAASFFSPQILYLATLWKPSPDVVLGVMLVLGAVACLFLPETLNRTLPVTLQDGENFGEDEKLFEFACCKAPTESTTELVVG